MLIPFLPTILIATWVNKAPNKDEYTAYVWYIDCKLFKIGYWVTYNR